MGLRPTRAEINNSQIPISIRIIVRLTGSKRKAPSRPHHRAVSISAAARRA
jgi:hypothetical protein